MPNETHSINGVEIFEVGEWNGDKYSEDDINRIIESFEETKAITKPYLKLGHGESQKLLAEDELPAAGKIERIYRKGKKIVADFTNIPKKIYELISKGAYSKVSSELYVNFKSNGKTFPYALKAVALLGGATPAVHSLNDILALYAFDKPTETLTFDALKAFEMQISEVNLNKTEDNIMTLEELTRQNAKLEAEIKSFQEENLAIEKDFKQAEDNLKVAQAQAAEYKAKADALETKVFAMEKEAREKEIDAQVASFQREGKIVPAQAPILAALLKNVKLSEDTKVFSVGDKEYSDVPSLVKAFVDGYSTEIKVEEPQSDAGQGVMNDDKFIDSVRKYAKEKNISIKQAMLDLSPSNSAE